MIVVFYLAKEIYKSSFIVLLSLVSLFTFFSLIDNIDNINNKLSIIRLIYINILSIPSFLYDLFPVSTLIGTTLSMAKLARDNELIIIRIHISKLKLLRFFFVLTIPIIIVSEILSEFIIPLSEIKNKEEKLYFQNNEKYKLSSGYWFKEITSDGRTRIINIGTIKLKRVMLDLKIYEYSADLENIKIINAKNGNLLRNNMILENVMISEIYPENSLYKEKNQNKISYSKNLPRTIIKTSLDYNLVISSILKPEHMSIKMLLDSLEYYKNNGAESNKQKLALWRKITNPLILFMMVLTALHIGLLEPRKDQFEFKIFLGITIGIMFFIINQLFLKIGVINNFNPYITALIPIVIYTAIFVIMLLFNKKNNLPWQK